MCVCVCVCVCGVWCLVWFNLGPCVDEVSCAESLSDSIELVYCWQEIELESEHDQVHVSCCILCNLVAKESKETESGMLEPMWMHFSRQQQSDFRVVLMPVDLIQNLHSGSPFCFVSFSNHRAKSRPLNPYAHISCVLSPLFSIFDHGIWELRDVLISSLEAMWTLQALKQILAFFQTFERREGPNWQKTPSYANTKCEIKFLHFCELFGKSLNMLTLVKTGAPWHIHNDQWERGKTWFFLSGSLLKMHL